MTPEEKAIDLLKIFNNYSHQPCTCNSSSFDAERDAQAEWKDNSHQCAIICVQNILEELEYMDKYIVKHVHEYRPLPRYDYWNKVLEILKAKREPEKTTIQQQPEKKTGLQSPGLWYARLEGCKTPENVDELEKIHADVINANPDLRRLFVIYKLRLKNKSNERTRKT